VAGNHYFSLCGLAKPALESGLSTQKAEGAQSSVDPTQWAVVVSKKVCRKAVDRNRLRRRLQALLRQHMVAATTSDSSPLWQQYSGLVLITRPPSAEAPFEELAKGLAELLQRIRPVVPPKPLEATP
jgi:ribonuclease P protein component